MVSSSTHPRWVTSVERILVALDHSPGLESIVDYACAIARGLGATMSLLHVYEPPNEMIGVIAGATVGGEVAAEKEAGHALLERAAERIRAEGLAVDDRVVERAASASQAIVHRARLGKFDLIVMGTHGRKGVARLVLGSTAEDVLRDAPCPVLVVHLPHD
jgi:nucleotide-binding universal stress UspA family protein